MVAATAGRTDRAGRLVPLVDALHQRMLAEKVMDFGLQMAWAARLACNFPQVGASCGPLPGGAARRIPGHGHAQRVALSALFGGGSMTSWR
ncbi:uvrD/Rep family helicase domain protein [Mycobacterium xenopi 4042]|uniref:UvrD/Rep family helicase domain protein n=1 Tax=Mycobacterium xenopi 4042 TaxID=1299334 RepID=X7YII9_MYCXE|nr:uvrD/Rep family helicase domain protein [Mycobacterium xenopi 4042]